MDKKRLNHLAGSLRRALGRKATCAAMGMSKEEIFRVCLSGGYEKKLAAVFDGGTLSCEAVEEAFRDTLCTLSPMPEEGWIKCAYRYACHLMFPEEGMEEKYRVGAIFFLTLLQVIFDAEEAFGLRPEALAAGIIPDADGVYAEEYQRFANAWRSDFVYEAMRLGAEATPYRTLEHIAGVNRVAVTMAREILRCGGKVNLALVSGAALGHDVGKFGCRVGERVPYLHYYYTDRWCRRHKLPSIGHIAANHSVWDLELENLTVESLLLIYADFRAKQERGPNGEEICRIFSLDDAFNVILSKLDNVDEAKRERYSLVYAKLHDFEEYMIALGCDVTLSGKRPAPLVEKDPALLENHEVVFRLKRRGVEHNLELMRRLSDRRSFSAILEAARSEAAGRGQRAYLSIFAAYSIYLNAAQKEQLLAFLYENLMHREGDIRRQAATIMGETIATFHAGYVKEVPAHHQTDAREMTDLRLAEYYVSRILYPDHKTIAFHRRWLNYTLKTVLESLLRKCDEERRSEFTAVFLRFFHLKDGMDDDVIFTLLDTAASIPLHGCTQEDLENLLSFAAAAAERRSAAVRGAVLSLLEVLLEQEGICRHAREVLEKLHLTHRSLALRRSVLLDKEAGEEEILRLGDDAISEIFLENLKAATSWMVKKHNISILQVAARGGSSHQLLHIATHLSNLLMVSEQVTIRRTAGAVLLRIADMMSVDQRNEVAVELSRGLETGQQEYAKYIPSYLGRFYLYLPPALLEEALNQLNTALCSSNTAIVSAALATAGVLYEYYADYRNRFRESEEDYRDRQRRILGMLLKGLAGFRDEVRREALQVIGEHIYDSCVLSREEKRRAFTLSAKKMLFLMGESGSSDMTFFYRAAAMGQIYRFITVEQQLHGGFEFEERNKIAFFPGTFDPFTLSHKGIVRMIRDLGFEVMLSIDEFSWSKKTQPHRVRRRLATTSVADEFNVHVFPENFPVNLTNAEDLRALREAFCGKELYIVVGSDVVQGASAYRAAPSENSIHTFHHVVFRRGREKAADTSCIQGEVVELKLPSHLEDISSTRIRDAIDANRDVSNLIDPVAQEYIYRHSLYLREPLNKPVLQAEDLIFHTCNSLSASQYDMLLKGLLSRWGEAAVFLDAVQAHGDKVILLRREKTGEVIGLVTYSCLSSHELLDRLGDVRLSSYVRERSGGKAVAISGVYVPKGPQQAELSQYLLTEALVMALREEYTYAFYSPHSQQVPPYVRSVLNLQGFISAPPVPGCKELLVVDMRRPIILTRNMDTVIKPPLSENPRVHRVLLHAHQKLQKTLTMFYPGHLVLSISATLLHRRLVSRVAAINDVPAVNVEPRMLGSKICVPYGKILRNAAMPNTVTKTVHTDKIYEPDLSSFSIDAYPGYSSLENQVKVIRSFNRPAILVDDMLHDSKRLKRLMPLLEAEGAKVDTVLVGYLTGLGRDIAQELGCRTECIYYLPNLRMRFVESTLYPFIGGDSVRREENDGVFHPAINRIFPYAVPDYPENCADGSAFALSKCCMENARDILMTLEAEYCAAFSRNLTLERLGEVIISPLFPDKGANVSYEPGRTASAYVENDLEMLLRMHSNSIKVVFGG